MYLLVVEEYIGAEGFQEFSLRASTKKQCFIDPDTPFPERQDHPLMGRGRTGGHQGRPDRIVFNRVCGLDLVQGFQNRFERAARKRLTSRSPFAVRKRFQAPFLVNPLRFIPENNRITVKSDPELTTVPAAGSYRAG